MQIAPPLATPRDPASTTISAATFMPSGAPQDMDNDGNWWGRLFGQAIDAAGEFGGRAVNAYGDRLMDDIRGDAQSAAGPNPAPTPEPAQTPDRVAPGVTWSGIGGDNLPVLLGAGAGLLGLILLVRK